MQTGLSSDTTFQFEGRNVCLVDLDGETWFFASDIARELGYEHVPHLLRILEADEKGVHSVDTLGGRQSVSVISEPGVYHAIMQRRTNKAHNESLTARIVRFQRFVTHDVLPSIRKTGSYAARPAHALPQSFADALQLAANQARQIEQQQEALTEQAPKVEVYDRLLNADGLIGLQDAGRALLCHPNLFIRDVVIPDYCFRDGSRIVAKQTSVQRGLFENKAFTAPNDKVLLRAWMTPKGLAHFGTVRIPDHVKNPPRVALKSVPALAAAATAH